MNNRAWNATSRLSKATRTRCASELDEPQGVGSIRAALEQDLSGQRASQAVQDVMRSRRLRHIITLWLGLDAHQASPRLSPNRASVGVLLDSGWQPRGSGTRAMLAALGMPSLKRQEAESA